MHISWDSWELSVKDDGDDEKVEKEGGKGKETEAEVVVRFIDRSLERGGGVEWKGKCGRGETDTYMREGRLIVYFSDLKREILYCASSIKGWNVYIVAARRLCARSHP